MHNVYLKCTYEICSGECLVKYMIKKCDVSKVYKFYQYEKHSDKMLDKFEVKCNKRTRSHGLPCKVKELIEELINTRNITKPKKLYIKLHDKKYADYIPCQIDIKQIRNYIDYRNKSINGNHDVEGLKSYVEKLIHWDRVDDDELFVFSSNYATGSDEEHFHIG